MLGHKAAPLIKDAVVAGHLTCLELFPDSKLAGVLPDTVPFSRTLDVVRWLPNEERLGVLWGRHWEEGRSRPPLQSSLLLPYHGDFSSHPRSLSCSTTLSPLSNHFYILLPHSPPSPVVLSLSSDSNLSSILHLCAPSSTSCPQPFSF